jgi:hypothetical protein
MGKKIAWTDPAKTDLRAIDQPTALRILHIVARYLATGEGDHLLIPSTGWSEPVPGRELHPL